MEILRIWEFGLLFEDYIGTRNLTTVPAFQLNTSVHITNVWDLQYQTSTADSRTPDYPIFLNRFHHFLKTLPGMLDFMHREPADSSFQSIGMHLRFYTASGDIIRVLDYSPSFVPKNLTSINMTTQAGKATVSSLLLPNAGWCDVGRRRGAWKRSWCLVHSWNWHAPG